MTMTRCHHDRMRMGDDTSELRSHAGHDHITRRMFTVAVEESACLGDESVGAIREVMRRDPDRPVDLL